MSNQIAPSLLQIESSTACNGKCIFCPVGRGLRRKEGMMADDLFLKIINDAHELSIREVLLFLNGEPLIFNRLFDWLEELRKRGMVTTLFTNAAFLPEKKAIQLVSYSDVISKIFFSLSGKDRDTHMEIMRLDHDKVKENIIRFMKINNSKIATEAHIPLFSMTKDWISEWKALWKPIVGMANHTCMYSWGGDIEDSHLTIGKKRYCERLNHMTVLWDGRVSLCCMDADGQVILGDLTKQSISDVFNGPIATCYRQAHLEKRWNDMELCNKCNMNI